MTHLLKHLSKEALIAIVHKARCGKLLGLRTDEMSKEEIITHLVASRCPEIMKYIHTSVSTVRVTR
jgi:hypothetical protein